MKSKVLYVLTGLFAGFILLFMWFRLVDVNIVFEYIKNVKLEFTVFAAFFYLLSYFIRSIRWKILMSPTVRLAVSETYFYYMFGLFLNYLIPVRAGELLKCLIIKRKYQKGISKILPSILFDKMFDLFGLFPVLILIPFLTINIANALLILIYFLIIFLFLMILIILATFLYPEKFKSFITCTINKLFRHINQNFIEKLNKKIDIFTDGINLYKKKKKILLYSLFLTAMSIFFDSIFFLFLFFAFGQQISFVKILFGYTLIFLSYSLPHPPAQIGSNEIIMILIFSIGMGLDRIMVSAIMSFSHILTGIIIMVAGMTGFSYTGIKFMEIIKYGVNNYDIE